MQLPAVSDAITEARYQARKNGRSSIAAIDIRSALLDYQIPSDKALQQAFKPAIRRNGRGSAIPTTMPNLNAKIHSARPLHIRCIAVAFGSYPT
jgi:hypothetical protein